MKAVAIVLIVVAGWLYANDLDYREAVASERAAWMADNCIPTKPGQRGVVEVRNDGSRQCAIYENAGYGRAPRLVFAEAHQ